MGKFGRMTFFLFMGIILSSINLSIKNEPNGKRQTIGCEPEKENSEGCLAADLDFGKIPLYFIPNEGQVDERAAFYAKAPGYTLWLTGKEFVFERGWRKEGDRSSPRTSGFKKRIRQKDLWFERDVSKMEFLHSRENPDLDAVEITEHRVNYFIGKDDSKWRKNIPTSKAVLYRDLYKNIDLEVYGTGKQIEYDWLVKPGGNVEDIEFELRGVKETKIDELGNLIVELQCGKMEHKKPLGYQRVEDDKLDIEVRYRDLGNNRYGFEVEGYDEDYDLVIDPVVLLFSTYLGGTGNEEAYGVAVDDSGNAFVTGYTASSNFPSVNPYMSDSDGGLYDAFVTKLSASGSSLVYSTYLGGTGNDEGRAIAVDDSGNAFVTGYTASSNFPSVNPYMSDSDGGLYDAFVTKLSASGGSLVYSTYLGGVGSDEGFGIAVDGGNAYVTGYTASINFPCVNAYMYDPDGSIRDAFVTKLSASGGSLAYSTYLGGTGSDEGFGIAVDSAGRAYVTGSTASINFPRVDPYMNDPDGSAFDAFVTRLSASGGSLAYSTYLGGTGSDEGFGIAVHSAGRAYVTGSTASINFPRVDPYMNDPDGSAFDAFVAKLSSDDLPPDVVITNPPDGATVSGSVTVQATASDDDGVTRVDFYVDGDLDTSDSVSPYGFSWNTKGETNGGHTLEAVAYDTIGQTASDNVTVTVNNVVTFSLTIAANPGGTTDPSPGKHSFVSGSAVSIKAIPNTGYAFTFWTGDVAPEDKADNPLLLTINKNTSITANFLEIPSGAYFFIFDGDDFDGDGSSDAAVFRPSTGRWYIKDVDNYAWGQNGDIPVNGDYDGDGTTDLAVWRPSNGRWYLKGTGVSAWGTAGDIPVPGDYDGDASGKTNIAVWRPSNGRWYIMGREVYRWGTSGDIPVPGDYDGDGSEDIAVWRPSNGRWYIMGREVYRWGTSGDIPVPGDYDGDGSAEIAVWRPSNGRWYIMGGEVLQWGKAGDIPTPGDYDGDGAVDIAVWRPSNGRWYLKGLTNYAWGVAGDIPLVR